MNHVTSTSYSGCALSDSPLPTANHALTTHHAVARACGPGDAPQLVAETLQGKGCSLSLAVPRSAAAAVPDAAACPACFPP